MHFTVVHAVARGVLLDIEGTTSSIQFVYEEMFPFVRRELDGFLLANWHNPALGETCQQIACDAGHDSLQSMCGEDGRGATHRQCIAAEVNRLMDADAKTTGLKQLQGMIWRSAFESGQLRAHLFDDVPEALRQWREKGLAIRVYSSGSVAAQQLFFSHTIAGDLLPFIEAHYDTTTGPKRESASYTTIAQDWRLSPRDILFFSDVPAELDAAREAGLQTMLCCRPGNPALPKVVDHPSIDSFGNVCISISRGDRG